MNRVRVSVSVLGITGMLVGIPLLLPSPVRGGGENAAVVIGDGPVIRNHISQDDIDQGLLPPSSLMQRGREFFVASFNPFDGAGRPGAPGDGLPTSRPRRTF